MKNNDKMNRILSPIFWISLSVRFFFQRTRCIKYCSKVKRTTITAFEFFSCTLSISFSFFQSRASHVQFSRCAISVFKTQARKFHFKLFRCRDRDNFYTSAWFKTFGSIIFVFVQFLRSKKAKYLLWRLCYRMKRIEN